MTQPLRVALIAAAALAAAAWHYGTHRNAPRELTVIARDYAFDAPDSIPAGITTIQLENRGPELHHVALIRLDSGHTADEFAKTYTSDGQLPGWATFVGGPNAPAPGQKAYATLNLEPGHYLLTCLIPTPDGTPHLRKGMNRMLTVTGIDQFMPLPRAAVTVTLVDYGFDLSRPLTVGKQVIRVRNLGTQPHEIFLARLAPGQSAGDLLKWMEQRNGPLPVLPLGGLTPITVGGEAEITVDLTPGEYGLYCFVSDTRDGKPHVMHGMMRQITISSAVARAAPD